MLPKVVKCRDGATGPIDFRVVGELVHAKENKDTALHVDGQLRKSLTSCFPQLLLVGLCLASRRNAYAKDSFRIELKRGCISLGLHLLRGDGLLNLRSSAHGVAYKKVWKESEPAVNIVGHKSGNSKSERLIKGRVQKEGLEEVYCPIRTESTGVHKRQGSDSGSECNRKLKCMCTSKCGVAEKDDQEEVNSGGRISLSAG
jgi:hypothetical protein